MSLVTIQRSPSSSDINEELDSVDSINNISNCKNLNQDYFASKATVILQNPNGRRRSSVIKEEDVLQCSLKKVIELLQKDESLKVMTNLEKVNSKIDGLRYFCLIMRQGSQNQQEHIILGINVSIGRTSIGFVLPVYQDMSVRLDGDGGFKIKCKDGEKLFKPTSVHALWSTVQLLNKACHIAHHNIDQNWVSYYQRLIKSTRSEIAEWNRMLYADTVVNSNLAPKSAIGEYVMGTEMDEKRRNEEIIRFELEEIMKEEDMDNVTVVFLREKLQEKLTFNVSDYRRFIAEEILIICGKMDEASQIWDYLYLGSTYNASNLEELEKNKITHIVNVTRESENFFRDKFTYKNVEVFDKEETKLMDHFDSCHKFINQVKGTDGSCLVHCQRGISRSASIVISYMMKEFNMSLEEAYDHVKNKRDCVRPNDGFLQQLKTYEGILQASSNRQNYIRNEKRSAIKSFPNDFYRDDKEYPLESPTGSCPVEYKRSSVNDVYRSESVLTEASDTLMVSDELENFNNDVLISDDPPISDPNESDLMRPTESDRINIKDLSDNKFGLEEPVFSEGSVNLPCQASDSQSLLGDDTFRSDLNTTSSSDPFDSSCKRKLKIKSDQSWIKPSSNLNDDPNLNKGDTSGSNYQISSINNNTIQNFHQEGPVAHQHPAEDADTDHRQSFHI